MRAVNAAGALGNRSSANSGKTASAGAFALGARIAVAAVIVGVAIVRWRLAGVPLERDEGEYAYAGQLILRGIPPYTLAYNMKFPGVYYAYALIMALFGQTPRAIHFGLLLVNAASIVLVFAIGRRLAGEFSCAIAAVTFAILSLSQSILGVFAHATHFSLLFALAGFWLLLTPRGARRTYCVLAAGALLGVSVLMKQHAIFLLAWGAVLVAWVAFRDAAGTTVEVGPQDERKGRGSPRAAHRPPAQGPMDSALQPRDGNAAAPDGSDREPSARARRGRALIDLLGFAGSALLPLLALCLLFLWQGALGRFWFWTFGYAREYVTEIPISSAGAILARTIVDLTRSNLLLWILSLAGLGALWLTRRSRLERVFVTGLLAASCLSVCPGFYFRQHYFVLMLPAVALLVGVVFDVIRIELAHRVSSGRPGADARAGIAVSAGLFAAVVAVCLYPQSDFLFSMDLREASRTTYGANPFPESVDIARYIEQHTGPDDRIAVLGSEPQIYFYAKRLSATGYIYAYPLMEHQRYAAGMQAEMMREIESVHPAFLVLVRIPTSWIIRPDSDQTILQWAERYVSKCYDLAGIVDIVSMTETRLVWDEQVKTYKPTSGNLLAVFKRKSAEACEVSSSMPRSGTGAPPPGR